MISKISKISENIENDNLNKLREVFPQFVKDGEIDFDAMQAFLKKDGILSTEEKYGLGWSGKSSAFRALRTPSTGTLVPQKSESKNWDTTENIFIEGDNLEVLKLLQKHYREKIKMIYIDPPYNTGKDFVYKDNFTQDVAGYYEQTGQTKDGIKMTANTEKNGRYHSDWLTMMYPRLFLARNLLKEDGVIFVSIDDNEVSNLRLIMDEIFGEENLVQQLIWKKKTGLVQSDTHFVTEHEYILVYAKDITKTVIYHNVFEFNESDFNKLINGKRANLIKLEMWGSSPYKEDRPSLFYPIKNPSGKDFFPLAPDGRDGRWRKRPESLDEEHIHWQESKGRICPFEVIYYEEIGDKLKISKTRSIIYSLVENTDATKEMIELFGGRGVFSYPKPSDLISFLIKQVSTNGNNDVILDFFAGSGTTAHAVMKLNAEDNGNRKWICVQLPETTNEDSEAYKAGYKTISEISRERIRRAGEKIRKGDIGFKAYSLSSSNYRQWNTTPSSEDTADLIKQSNLFIEKPLVDKFNEESVVYEILIKEGFDLNTKVVQEKNELKTWVTNGNDKKLVVTFSNKVTNEQVEKLKFSENDIFVCFDNALDDTTKVNLNRNITIKTI